MSYRWWQRIAAVFFPLLFLVLFPAAAGFGAPAGAGGAAAGKAGPGKKVAAGVQKPAAGNQAAAVLSREERQRALARIREKFRRPELMQGHFTQTTVFADSTDTMVASGRIWLQGPDKMRWEYAEPEKQILVSNGRSIWYYTPDLNQVMTGSVKDMKEARIIVNLLSRLNGQVEGFDLEVSRGKQRLKLVLVPKKGVEAPPFERLEIYFSEPDLNLTETRLVDLFANRIAITYRWDGPLTRPRPQAFFMFVPPKGCDVMPLGQ